MILKKLNIPELDWISIEIVDVNGKKLFAQTDLKQNNNISLPNLSEGIYFVNLLKKGKIVSIKKLIKGWIILIIYQITLNLK